MRQRTSLRVSWFRRFFLFRADELDRTGHEIIDIFRSLNAAGSTIAIITHDTALADALPRQVHLRDGRVVRDDRSGAWS